MILLAPFGLSIAFDFSKISADFEKELDYIIELLLKYSNHSFAFAKKLAHSSACVEDSFTSLGVRLPPQVTCRSHNTHKFESLCKRRRCNAHNRRTGALVSFPAAYIRHLSTNSMPPNCCPRDSGFPGYLAIRLPCRSLSPDMLLLPGSNLAALHDVAFCERMQGTIVISTTPS